MNKEEAINIIRDYLSRQPVEWVGVFGSFARNEMHADSDIDVVLDFKENAQVNLFDFVGYKQDLEALLQRKIDLATYKYLRPKFKAVIDKDIQIIYKAAWKKTRFFT